MALHCSQFAGALINFNYTSISNKNMNMPNQVEMHKNMIIQTPSKSPSFSAMNPPPTPGRNHTPFEQVEVPAFFAVTQSLLGAEHEPSESCFRHIDSLKDMKVPRINISRRSHETQPIADSRKRSINVSLLDIPKLPFDFALTDKPKIVTRVISTDSYRNQSIEEKCKNATEDVITEGYKDQATKCSFAKSA